LIKTNIQSVIITKFIKIIMDLLKNQFQCIRMNQDVPSHSEAELKRTSKPVSKRMKKQRRKLEDYARF
tara:strand:+ start:34 stop:237 length:204 start_codon:yes stop_codon:yes gene_type:complete